MEVAEVGGAAMVEADFETRGIGGATLLGFSGSVGIVWLLST